MNRTGNCSAVCREILCAYGVGEVKGVMDELGFLYSIFKYSCPEEETRRKLDTYFEQAMPKAYYVAGRICRNLDEMDQEAGTALNFLFSLSLHEYMVETMEFHGLIVAHGDSTASSIQKVANRTCRTFVFEAIDMPMDTAVEDTITKGQAVSGAGQYKEGHDSSGGHRFPRPSCILPSKMTLAGDLLIYQ